MSDDDKLATRERWARLRFAIIGPLFATAPVEDFTWRVENTHVREGGFALITGAPGTGKSVALRLLAHRLEHLPDLTVAALAHPSAKRARDSSVNVAQIAAERGGGGHAGAAGFRLSHDMETP